MPPPAVTGATSTAVCGPPGGIIGFELDERTQVRDDAGKQRAGALRAKKFHAVPDSQKCLLGGRGGSRGSWMRSSFAGGSAEAAAAWEARVCRDLQ